ncbi:MAG: repeat containing protein [Bacteroidetes bacterium]|nr:repeat containing protein [Bacteroidota bacterium]
MYSFRSIYCKNFSNYPIMKKTTILLFGFIFIITTLWLGCDKNNDPEITIANDTIFFASTCVGTTVTEEVRLTNTGKEDLVISSVSVEGGDECFSVTGNYSTIAAGADCNVELTFGPTGCGTKTADLVIKSNAKTNPEYTLALTGEALPQPGKWEGTDVQFYVSVNGTTLTPEGSTLAEGASLIVTAKGNACGGYITMTRYYSSEIPIENSGFSFISSDDNITGTFTEDNVCNVSGSIDGAIYYPSVCNFTLQTASLHATPAGTKSADGGLTNNECILEYYPDGKIRSRIEIVRY